MIDLEDFNEKLVDFGYSCPNDEDIGAKLNEIAQHYDIGEDELADEVTTVLLNTKKSSVDENVLSELESELDKKLQKAIDAKKAAKKSRPALADRTLAVIGKQSDQNISVLDETIVSANAVTGKYADFSPYPDSPSNSSFLKRAIDENPVVTVVGAKYKKLETAKTCEITVVSQVPKQQYGGEKISNVIEDCLRSISEAAQRIKEANPEITEWGNATKPSSNPVYAYGEVVKRPKHEGKLSEDSTCLLLDDENGKILSLDVSQVTDLTLFPGQRIAVKGLNETGETLVVEKIFHPPELYPLPIDGSSNGASIEVWCAAGPFTSSENCAYEQLCELLDKAAKKEPTVLILTGPFLDRKNKFLQSADFRIRNAILFDELLTNIAKKLQGSKTKIVIQPSSQRDVTVPPVFPAPAFQHNGIKNVHFVPEPCVLQLNNGVRIAVSNSEIVAHLSKDEWNQSPNQENQDRIGRLFSHILTERSLYPLKPPAISATLESEVCRLEEAPHLIILPSVLPPVVKKVGRSVFVNPGPLAKGSSGTFVTSSINIPAEGIHTGDISNTCSFSILKI